MNPRMCNHTGRPRERMVEHPDRDARGYLPDRTKRAWMVRHGEHGRAGAWSASTTPTEEHSVRSRPAAGLWLHAQFCAAVLAAGTTSACGLAHVRDVDAPAGSWPDAAVVDGALVGDAGPSALLDGGRDDAVVRPDDALALDASDAIVAPVDAPEPLEIRSKLRDHPAGWTRLRRRGTMSSRAARQALRTDYALPIGVG